MTHLKALRLAAEKATPAPWVNDEHAGPNSPYLCHVEEIGRDEMPSRWVTVGRFDYGRDKKQDNNKEFILQARNHIIPLLDRVEKLEGALLRIEKWEMPSTGQVWDDGSPVSYGVRYGSNGERDYIKSIATEALKENT